MLIVVLLCDFVLSAVKKLHVVRISIFCYEKNIFFVVKRKEEASTRTIYLADDNQPFTMPRKKINKTCSATVKNVVSSFHRACSKSYHVSLKVTGLELNQWLSDCRGINNQPFNDTTQ